MDNIYTGSLSTNNKNSDAIKRLCELLGVDPKELTFLSVEWRPGEAIKVTTSKLVLKQDSSNNKTVESCAQRMAGGLIPSSQTYLI